MPTLARLAARGEVGRAAVIPPGMAPGSDVGNMSILGYDPARFHTGRAPIEAAALGLRLRPDQVAYRCNLSTVSDDGVMLDFAGGHPTTEEAAEVIEALDEQLGRGAGADIELHAGVQYRHILVAPADWADADCTPPHDLSDKPVVWPTGPGGRQGAGGHGRQPRASSVASGWWPTRCGSGARASSRRCRASPTRPAARPALVTAVDLIRGLGVLTDIDRVEVPGATGWFDTDYEGKRDAALGALEAGCRPVPHPRRGHRRGRTRREPRGEGEGARGVGPTHPHRPRRRASTPWVRGACCCSPTTPRPVELKTHTTDSVPYLLVDSATDGAGGTYTEPATEGCTAVPGHELMAPAGRRSLGKRSVGRDAELGAAQPEASPRRSARRTRACRRPAPRPAPPPPAPRRSGARGTSPARSTWG